MVLHSTWCATATSRGAPSYSAASGSGFLVATTLRRTRPVLDLVRPPQAHAVPVVPVVLTPAEIPILLGLVRYPLVRMCLTILDARGLRIAEGLHLTTHDIDGARLVVHIWHGRATATAMSRSPSACSSCSAPTGGPPATVPATAGRGLALRNRQMTGPLSANTATRSRERPRSQPLCCPRCVRRRHWLAARDPAPPSP